MTDQGEIIEVHSRAILSSAPILSSRPILSSGRCAPVGPGRKQPGWPVGCAASSMEEHDVSTCVRFPPD
jgi:hypothetical protein